MLDVRLCDMDTKRNLERLWCFWPPPVSNWRDSGQDFSRRAQGPITGPANTRVIQCTRVSQPGIAYETDHRFTHIYHTCYMVSMHPGDRIPHKNQARASPSSGTPLLHQQSSSHDPRKCLSSALTSALQPWRFAHRNWNPATCHNRFRSTKLKKTEKNKWKDQSKVHNLQVSRNSIA